MSKTGPQHHTLLHPDRQTKGTQVDEREAVKQIDTSIQHLSDRIIPPQPYLLSVPTDIPYRFDKRFLNTWYIGTPFGPHEEQLQYMSFLPHDSLEEELLKVVGGWSDSDGNYIDEEASSQTQTLSGQNTPIPQPHRKKISLQDYKEKDKSKPQEQALQGKQNGHTAMMKSEARERNPKTEERPRKAQEDRPKPIRPEKPDQKLQMPRPLPARPPTIIRRPDSPSPPKRRRLSEEPISDSERVKGQRKEEAKDKKKSLPALLSPTLPASDKDKADRGLPKLLSPHLPPSLQKVLAAENEHPSHKVEQSKFVVGNTTSSPAAKKTAERPVENGHNRSDSQPLTKASGVPGKPSPHLKPLVKAESRPTTPVQQTRSPGPRQRHIIALKYGRKNKKRVEALLKFAPRPKKVKPLTVVDDSTRQGPDPARDTGKALSSIVKPERKRLAEASPERPVKKIRPLIETPERPRTPGMATKSPAVRNKADLQATPKKESKELKPSAMQRIASSEGADVRTPLMDRGRTSTPVGSLQTKDSPVPGSGSGSAVRDTDRAGWTELKAKYFALGRSLKREAQNLASSESRTDQPLSVVLHIEALLCFMVNLSAESLARPGSDPGWNTIMPYHIFVFKASRKYRPLHGLVIQLGAVCRQILHNHNIDRLHRDPLPDEECGSAPTPGSDGNTKTDDGGKYRRRYIEFKNDLVLNSKELQSAWLEGSRYLSPSVVESEYPKTWVGRTKDASSRGFQKLDPKKISDVYYLPLDVCSTAFEVTRFAVSLLGEWCEKEQTPWRARIDL